MLAISLQSGSNGNCYYVEAGGVRLLFDAGLSGRQTRRRLASFGREAADVDALIISHDHSDHVRSAGILHRMFKLPLFMTGPTLERCRSRLGRLRGTEAFGPGDTLRFGPVTVKTVSTPHDAVDGTAFVVCSGGKRLGLLTDLGHPFPRLGEILPELDGVFIESNYDPQMLDGGPYPEFLKRRIKGPGGHISNCEAAELLGEHASDRLRWVCLAHLSENNNTPRLALATHREILHPGLALEVATRHQPSRAFQL